MNEDNNGLKPNIFFQLPGSKEWKPLGTAVTPHFPDENVPQGPKVDFNKPFSCSAEVVVKSKKQQRELRKFLYGKKHRLPRKLKKAGKGVVRMFPDGYNIVKRYEMTYGWKRDTKWKRKVYNLMCKPIIKPSKIPKIENLADLQRWNEYVLSQNPVVLEPNKTISLNAYEHDD